jgi:hypothetical protein
LLPLVVYVPLQSSDTVEPPVPNTRLQFDAATELLLVSVTLAQ